MRISQWVGGGNFLSVISSSVIRGQGGNLVWRIRILWTPFCTLNKQLIVNSSQSAAVSKKERYTPTGFRGFCDYLRPSFNAVPCGAVRCGLCGKVAVHHTVFVRFFAGSISELRTDKISIFDMPMPITILIARTKTKPSHIISVLALWVRIGNSWLF